MTDLPETGIILLGTNTTRLTATPELRFRGGELQQCWLVEVVQAGFVQHAYRQWQAVPSVSAETPDRDGGSHAA